MAMPAAQPVSMTQGIPDPQQIKSQQEEFARNLDRQAQEQQAAVKAEAERRQKYLEEQSRLQTAVNNLNAPPGFKYNTVPLEQQIKAQNAAMEQQTQFQLNAIEAARLQQRNILDQQAAALNLDYQQKKAQEDMLKKQLEIQKNFYEAEKKLVGDLAQSQQQFAAATTAALPQQQFATTTAALPRVGPPLGMMI